MERNVITIDNANNILSAGIFRGSVDFDPSLDTFLLNGILNQANFFISKSDSFGNFIWAKKISLSTGNSDVSSISSDNAGNVYVSGYFMDSVDFDPGPNIFMLKTIIAAAHLYLN
jgi:hypothetical protein